MVGQRGDVARDGVDVVVFRIVGGVVEAGVEDAPVVVIPLAEIIGGEAGGTVGCVVDDGAFVGFEVGPVVPGAPVLFVVESVAGVAVQEFV